MNVAEPLVAALRAEAGITTYLTAYKSSWPIFTRRPAPADAPDPVIIVSPDVTLEQEDFIIARLPIIVRDIAVYGSNVDATVYRKVEATAYAVRALFHRKRLAITVPGWFVLEILASGPIAAPVDDDAKVGRVVSLTIRLSSKS